MKYSRVIAAFLITPIIPVFGYFLLTLSLFLLPIKGDRPEFNLAIFLVAILPITYGITLLLWLPTFLFLKYKNLSRLVHYMLAGALVFGLLSLAVFGFQVEAITFNLICAFLGSIFALVFWLIAGPPPFAKSL
jgi:hypothetical protein